MTAAPPLAIMKRTAPHLRAARWIAGWCIAFASTVWAGGQDDGLQRVRAGEFDISVSIATPLAVRGGHPKDHPEQTMHGGKPRPGDRHVFVSIIEWKTRKRISTAMISARFTDSRGGVEEKALERMTISNAAGYGNYFALAAVRPITLDLDIRGLPTPLSARFKFPQR